MRADEANTRNGLNPRVTNYKIGNVNRKHFTFGGFIAKGGEVAFAQWSLPCDRFAAHAPFLAITGNRNAGLKLAD